MSVDRKAIRNGNLAYLTNLGFKTADSLPLGPPSAVETTALRPNDQVAGRLWALNLLFLYAADREDVASGEIQDVLAKTDAHSHLTEDEAKIIELQHNLAIAHHSNLIGWKLENMLPLAWMMGFDVAPSVDGEMITGDVTQAMLAFIPWQRLSLPEWIEKAEFRSLQEAVAMEDLFYCAHNAVRSAQLGSETVPRGFHPVINGGVIHERRHSLTWALSPGVAWDDTDLST